MKIYTVSVEHCSVTIVGRDKDGIAERITGLSNSKVDPKELDKTPPIDHLTNLMKAIFSSLPAGGAIASIMSDYIPSAKQARVLKFIREVNADLRNLEVKIDENYLTKDQVAYVIEESIRGTMKYYQEEKLEYYRGILVNTIRADATGGVKEEVDYYLYLVDNLSAIHLRILAFLYDPDKYFSEKALSKEKVKDYSLSQVFHEVFPDVNVDLISSAFKDLYRFNLTNTESMGGMTAARGLDIVRGRVTALGTSFVKFCKDYKP